MIDEVLDRLVADKYRVAELIREGESGDLYHARHEIMDSPVTIKVLPLALGIDARWARAFVEQARAAASVTHPNILNLNDFGTDAKNVTYAVYEPLTGKTLADERSMRDERSALELARQIAAAVAEAHEKGIVHGNLCPKNVFLEGDGETLSAKVYGFGRDTTNVARGADPRYLAPEQLGEYPVTDQRSDIFSLGVMFYEMLSGEVPFDGGSAAEIAAKHQNEPPPPLSAFRKDLNSEIEPIILSAIAVDPERRYQKMSALAEDINLLVSRIGGGTNAVAAAAAGDAPKRNVWQTAFVVLAGITLLAAALIYATSTRGTDPTDTLQADADSMPVQPLPPATGGQEESLAKIPDEMSPEQIMAFQGLSTTTTGADSLPGGDGYNAWANGGAPPPGAPPPNLPPGGQRVSGDVTGNSQFMPPTGAIEFVRKDILTGECTRIETREVVPCPDQSGAKPLAVPPATKPPANVVKPAPSRKPDASPALPTEKPADTTTDKPKTQPSPKTPPRQKNSKPEKPAGGDSQD